MTRFVQRPSRLPAALAAALTAVLAAVVPGAAPAQDYPSKPIRFIVPTPPGSGPDADMRHIGARLAPLLGQPVLIDNRPGAATRIAIEAAVKAPADGYTFLVGTPSLTTAPSLYAKLPFDTRRDLVPVSLLSTTAYALVVNAQVPAQTAAAYAALAKANPAYANVATFGIGTIPHLAGAWFSSLAGSDFKFIHYNTTAPFNDLLAGQTQAMFEALLPSIGNIRAGKLRVLAISGRQRHAIMPEVPTFAEAGYAGYDPLVWIGVLAPAGTPPAIVNRVSAALAQVAKSAEVVAYRRDVGSDSIGSTPEEYGAFLEAERAKWGAVIQRIGLKLD
ncbi:MAG: tripartite tricarboxylate transporter substrate binding protein [Burkholderiales bacterium]|nr:tripartite tricarboxylate transporter substrate binding protein [Burkholderiales bacterium]